MSAPRVRVRAPSHLLQPFIVQARLIGPSGEPDKNLMLLGEFEAITSTGALVQASHAMARNKLNAAEVVATPGSL